MENSCRLSTGNIHINQQQLLCGKFEEIFTAFARWERRGRRRSIDCPCPRRFILILNLNINFLRVFLCGSTTYSGHLTTHFFFWFFVFLKMCQPFYGTLQHLMKLLGSSMNVNKLTFNEVRDPYNDLLIAKAKANPKKRNSEYNT